LLGPGPRFIKKKKNLPGRGLTKVEKHWATVHKPRPQGTKLLCISIPRLDLSQIAKDHAQLLR